MAPPATPSAAAPATTDPWRRRLLTLLIGLFAVGVVVGWASTSYFGRNPAAVESFAPTDGWCDPASQGLGVHCFGDFQVPRLFLDEESIYDPIYPAPGVKPVPNPYTPTSMAPHVFAGAIEWVGLGQRTSMVVFLVLLAAAMLVPALWSILGRPGRPRDWLPLLVIGVASGPFLTMMDRGNSAGFAVPFILLFALYVRRRPEWVAPVAMISAALIRPQFILLALALIAFGRIRSAAAAVAAWAAVSIAAFAVIPGGFASNLSGWWSDLADFQDQLDGQGVPVVASTEFINISAAHALTVIDDWFVGAPGFLGTRVPMLTDWVVANPVVPGAVLALGALVTVLFAPSRRIAPLALVIALIIPVLTQALSFGYYLMVVLVLAALILGPSARVLEGDDGPGAGDGIFAGIERASAAMRAWAWVVLVAVGLSVVPMLITSDISTQSTLKGLLGVLWLAVVIATLVLAWVRPRALGLSPASAPDDR